MNPKQRVHRILKPLSAYEDLSHGSRSEWSARFPVSPNDHVLGVYKSDSDAQHQIVVTKDVILIHDKNGWTRVRYHDIVDVRLAGPSGDLEPNQKFQADRLVLELSGGSSTTLLVEGGNDGFRDVFEFARFLDRIRHDIARG